MKIIKILTIAITFSLVSCTSSEFKLESSSSDEALLSIVEGVLLELEKHDELASCPVGETLIERRIPALEHKAMLAVEKLEILSKVYSSAEITDSVRARVESKMSEFVEKAISSGILFQSGITEFLNVDYLEFLIDGGDNQLAQGPVHILSKLNTSRDEIVFNNPLIFQSLFYPTNYFNRSSRAHNTLIDLALSNRKIEELYDSKSRNLRDYPQVDIQAEFNAYVNRLFNIYNRLLRYGCFSSQNFYNPRLQQIRNDGMINLSLNRGDDSTSINTRGLVANTNCPIAFEGGIVIPKNFFYDGFFKTVNYCVPDELLNVLPLDHSYYWESRSRIRDVDMALEQAPQGGDIL